MGTLGSGTGSRSLGGGRWSSCGPCEPCWRGSGILSAIRFLRCALLEVKTYTLEGSLSGSRGLLVTLSGLRGTTCKSYASAFALGELAIAAVAVRMVSSPLPRPISSAKTSIEKFAILSVVKSRRKHRVAAMRHCWISCVSRYHRIPVLVEGAIAVDLSRWIGR